MASKLDRVVAELSELIQDEGLTPERVLRFGNTIQGVMKGRPWELAHEIYLLSLALGDDKYAQALRYAFGVTVPPPHEKAADNLTERRSQLLESGLFPEVSEATLRRWEKTAMKLLAQRILEQGDIGARDMPLESPAASLVLHAAEARKAHEEAMKRVRLALRLTAMMQGPVLDDSARKSVMDAVTSIQEDQAKLMVGLNEIARRVRQMTYTRHRGLAEPGQIITPSK